MKKLLSIIIALCFFRSVSGQDYRKLRTQMVNEQIKARGVQHKPTLAAMLKVERHQFVPITLQKNAYEDRPLSIGYHQTISQPFIVAYMTALLQPDPNDRILEIGSGSGYQAAVLAEIVLDVYTIEIVRELGEQTKKRLKQLGYENIHVVLGDGYQGLAKQAPFDGIVITAAVKEIPAPLISQLKEGGRMVVPVGPSNEIQTLVLLEKRNGKLKSTKLSKVRFVPFTRERNHLGDN